MKWLVKILLSGLLGIFVLSTLLFLLLKLLIVAAVMEELNNALNEEKTLDADKLPTAILDFLDRTDLEVFLKRITQAKVKQVRFWELFRELRLSVS